MDGAQSSGLGASVYRLLPHLRVRDGYFSGLFWSEQKYLSRGCLLLRLEVLMHGTGKMRQVCMSSYICRFFRKPKTARGETLVLNGVSLGIGTFSSSLKHPKFDLIISYHLSSLRLLASS